MPAIAAAIGDPLINELTCLQKHLVKFEEDCMDENFTKLFNELNKRGQSIFHKSDYLDSLTINIILKDILLYRPAQIANLNHPMTNKEKLSLLYGLYHNYCWRQFDRLYNPKVEGSFGVSELCAGGTQFSQDPLMIKCKNLINVSKASQQQKLNEGRYDDLESIRERLHALKETVKYFSDTLSENDVALNQLTRVVDEGNFNKKYFAKLTLECNGVIRFQYAASDPINFSRMESAHKIDIDELRKMIALIFKIKIPTKND